MGTKSKVVCIFAGLLIIVYSIVMMRRGNFYFSTGKIFVMGIGMVLISLYEYIFSAIKLFKSKLDEDSSRHEE